MHPHLIQLEPAEDTLAIQSKIKQWVRDALHLPEETVVTVSETRCPDPACPVVETVILVHDSTPPRQFRFGRPKAAVTKMHVVQGLSGSDS